MARDHYPMPLFTFLVLVSLVSIVGPHASEGFIVLLQRTWPVIALLAIHAVLHLRGIRGRGPVYHAVQSAMVVGIGFAGATASPVITLTAWLCGEAVGTAKERRLRIGAPIWHSAIGLALILLVEGRADALDWILAALPTVAFVMVVVLLYAREARARESAEELSRELADANRRIAAYAVESAERSREDERRRMARDLHDTLAQGLAGLVLQLQAVETHLGDGHTDNARSILDSSMEQARRTLKESRRAIDDLRSEIGRKSEADVSALVHGLSEHLSSRYGTPVRVRSDISGEAPVPERIVPDLSAIIREAVHNAVHHGDCYEVRIGLSTQRGLLKVHIDDSGRGFDKEHLPVDGHYGIRGMKERAHEIGATFALSSRPGHGTSVELTLPLAVGAAHG